MRQDAPRPTRVLFVNTRSALGADVAVHLLLIRHLDPSRCKLFLATNARSKDLEATLREVAGVRDLRPQVMNLGYELAGRSKPAKLLGALGNLAELAVALARLSGIVRRNRIDIIHTTDRPRDVLVGALLARLTGRKNIVHIHVKWERPSGRAARWAHAHSDAALAISDFVKRSLLDGGVPSSKVFMVLNAIETERFAPLPSGQEHLRSAMSVAPETPVIGIVARIMQWKGHRELVRALAWVRNAVPDVHLAVIGVEDLLAGAASYRAEVQQEAEQLGVADRVHWLGWQDDMPAHFAGMDLVCVPSWEEPFGLVVTEAMAMRRPVVGFASGALPEIICSGAEGILVPSRDVEALADAIVKLLKDPALRATLGENARQRVLQDFTAERQATQMAAVYDAMLAN